MGEEKRHRSREQPRLFDKLPFLREKGSRHSFLRKTLLAQIAVQVKENRLTRGWSQKELARRAGIGIPAVSRIENESKAGPRIDTLSKIASAFDCALIVRFVSWSTFLLWISESGVELICQGFEDEDTK